MTTLRLILGDQLNAKHSWYETTDPNVVYCMMEMRQETDYVQHHIQKVVGFFAAMRAFANGLIQNDHRVEYFKINDPHNRQELNQNLNLLIEKYGATRFEYQLPDEYRLDEQLKSYCKQLSIPSAAFDTEHFLSSRSDVESKFENKKQVLMESFYRDMRKRYHILMDGDKPIGDKWNFDHDNRNKWKGKPKAPAYTTISNNVSEIHQTIIDAQIKTIGHIDPKQFLWPINRYQSLQLLEYFVEECLPYFGQFQDAMSTQSQFLFHARLSFALNTKMLHPMEVVDASIDGWKKREQEISLAQVEGFVRQIIGWREYMRGIYWWKMPNFASLNYFNHTRKLPAYFWNGGTKMNCVKNCVQNSLDNGYAHHIQRLMVTGNFALLAGIHPDEVDAWYLGIYIDAIEWVEITNTRGMSQYADGGIVGSKPYVSSANYIDKMSDYCSGCHYDKSKKYGFKACPFNSLYWHFYDRNMEQLRNNQRVSMMLNVWQKMAPDEKVAILKQADTYLQNIEQL